MKITDVHVDGFGVWNDMSVNDLPSDVTVFYGPNEAGKSTLMQFLRSILYGFSPKRRQIYLPPVHGGTPGGLLRVACHNGDFVVQRFLGSADDEGTGRITVLSDDGRRQGQHLINVLLSGVDESIYNNVFAIGIQELQELGSLNDTQAAEQLYNLTTGMDRVSLVDVMRQLDDTRTRLLGDDPKHSEIPQLENRRQVLLDEIDDLRDRTRRWSDLAQSRASLIGEVSQLEQTIVHLEQESRVAETAMQVQDSWLAREQLSQDLRQLGPLRELPEGCLERLDDLKDKIEITRKNLVPVRRRRQELRREISAQPINQTLWDGSCRIEALCEHAPWIASLDGQIEKLNAELEESEARLAGHGDKLGEVGGIDFSRLPMVSPASIRQLKEPAKAVRDAALRRSAARKQREHSAKQAEYTTNQLKEELAERKEANLDEAIARVSNQVSLMRRKAQLDERVQQMSGHRNELAEDHQDALDEQLHSLRYLMGIGIIFTAGTVLLLLAVFGASLVTISAEMRLFMGFIGGAAIILAVVWKSTLEANAFNDVDASESRRSSLETQLADATKELEKIDKQLPRGQGTLETRLEAAEKELQELEAMVPLNADHSEAEKQKKAARQHADNADEELRDARRRWRRALRRLGLPETLTPKHTRQLAAHYEEASRLQSTTSTHREQLERLTTERQHLTDRIQNLYDDVGMKSVSEDPQIQLSQLAAALSGQRDMIENRKTLKSEEREVRKQHAELVKTLRRYVRLRDALLSEARVVEENELRELAATNEIAGQLSRERDQLTAQIRGVLGDKCSDLEIRQMLEAHAEIGLETYYEQLLARLQDSQTRIGGLHQRRGEINQEMKSLAEDRRLAAARFELGTVEQQLRQAIERWQVVTTALRLLETIREIYEKERQPETLAEASDYLESLTDGRYCRVWTPLGQNVLRVDDREGKSLSMEVLSRGTREAVFLSLRLALTAAYARRGVALPMVLDDVLVNLDAHRTRLAVKTLVDFSRKGHQLLFFTCHQHVRDMFREASVNVRTLPAHPSAQVIVEDEPPLAAPVPEPIVAVEVLPEPEPTPVMVEPEPEPVVEPEIFEPEILDAEVEEEEPAPEPPPIFVELPPEPDPAPFEEEEPMMDIDLETYDHEEFDDEPNVEEEEQFAASSTWESPHTWWREEETAA